MCDYEAREYKEDRDTQIAMTDERLDPGRHERLQTRDVISSLEMEENNA
jgi:hypothetical protein